MSGVLEAKLEELGDMIRTAEAKMLTLQFEKTKLEQKNEELERELALATLEIEKQQRGRR